jgi:hypothetical protein
MTTKDAASVRVTDPPTEAEIGQVLIALAAFPTLHGIVRRLAFQRDQMATPAAPAPASEDYEPLIEARRRLLNRINSKSQIHARDDHDESRCC